MDNIDDIKNKKISKILNNHNIETLASFSRSFNLPYFIIKSRSIGFTTMIGYDIKSKIIKNINCCYKTFESFQKDWKRFLDLKAFL